MKRGKMVKNSDTSDKIKEKYQIRSLLLTGGLVTAASLLSLESCLQAPELRSLRHQYTRETHAYQLEKDIVQEMNSFTLEVDDVNNDGLDDVVLRTDDSTIVHFYFPPKQKESNTKQYLPLAEIEDTLRERLYEQKLMEMEKELEETLQTYTAPETDGEIQ